MATGANNYNQHQWSSPGTGNHPYPYPNHKEDMKHVKKQKVVDFVEFGKAFDIPATISDQGVQIAYQRAVEDFLKEKMTNFPDWDGLPELKVSASKDYGQMLSGGKQLAWYAKVPKKYVLTEDDKIQKLDEELWDS